MLLVLYTAFFACAAGTKALNFSFHQSDFIVKYERAEVVSFSPEYFSGENIKNYKFNRTQAVSNITFTMEKDLSEPFKVEIQAYKFMSNEYRHFPVRFSYSFCQMLHDDDFGAANLLKCGNLTRAGCPYRKGTYHMCKFFLDSEKFPPHIPEGAYMLDMKGFIDETEVIFLQGYGTINYKNFWFH